MAKRDSAGKFKKPSYPNAKFHFNLCDWWVGFFWDKRDRRLFMMFLPVGIVFDFGPRPRVIEITKGGRL